MTEPIATVLAAGIAAVPATVAAGAAWRQARKASLHTIGNGSGTLAQMLELTLQRVSEVQQGLNEVRERMYSAEGRISSVEAKEDGCSTDSS